jgi:ABC-type uncharacterized transport system permease subunit
MEIVVFAQQVVNGLANGMGYVLIAVGLTLVFGVLRIVNFAHGEFYMLGAYFTYYITSLAGIDYLGALVIATVAVAAIGVFANQFFFRPLRKEHEFTILLSSLGLALLMANGAEYLFGADPKYVNTRYADETVDIGPLVVTQQRLLVIAVALVMIAATYWFIRFTRMGKMMQATAQNPEGAALTGTSDSTFEGGGNSAANNVFTGNVSVTVIEVYPNGNLLVSGEKQVTINQGTEYIRFSGVVNPLNVGAANTVSSTRVADARIEYKGRGYMSEAQTMGFLQRFFLSASPF